MVEWQRERCLPVFAEIINGEEDWQRRGGASVN
jgi:hypothetical protein